MPTIERYFGHQCLIPALQAIGQSRQVVARGELPPHREDNFEIHLILDGSVNWWVENETYQLPPDSVYITKPGELHGGVTNMIQPCSLTWLQVDAHQLASADLQYELYQIDRRMWLGASELIGFVTAMLAECRHPQADSQRILSATLNLFLAKLLRQCQHAPHSKSVPDQFELLRRYIDTHLNETVTIAKLSDYANLSRSRIFQLFDEHLGQSPISYMMSMRIKQAGHRLRQTDDAITTIALELGFSSSQHFATAFKRHTGLSPRDYRRARSF